MDQDKNLSDRSLRSDRFSEPLATSSPNRSKLSTKIIIDIERFRYVVESAIEDETLKLNERKDEIERAFTLRMCSSYRMCFKKRNNKMNDMYYVIEDEETKQDENIDPETINKAKSPKNKNYSRKTKSDNQNGRKNIQRMQKSSEKEDTEIDGSWSSRITRAKKKQILAASISDGASSSNQGRTPLRSRGNYQVAAVTPKPNIASTPATILRRPKPGEMAISLTGSPLMLGPTMVPHVNIPLRDGRVMAVLGNGGQIDTDDFPELNDTTTMEQLRKLHQFLGEAITSKKKN